MRVNLLKSIGGIIVCGYILLLACRDQLGFYIHPRYHIFASIISIVGIVLLLIDTMLQLKLKVSVKPIKFSLKRVKPASYLVKIRELIRYRDLVFMFIKRDFVTAYKQKIGRAHV